MRDEQQRTGWRRNVVHCLVAGLLGGLALTGVARSAAAQSESASAQDRLRAAVAQLTAEAEELDQIHEPAHPPVFSRPHPAIEGWDAEMGPLVLDRLRQAFTGNAYRDAYIRWHLMTPVKQMLSDAFTEFRDTEQHELPPNTAQQLTDLARNLPPALQQPLREESRWVPADIAAEYWRLHGQTRVTVGIPPFEHNYHGAGAVQHVAEEDRERWQQMADRMSELRAQMQQISDPEAIAYNNRIRQVNSIVRDYRGDVIYALVQSGDESLLGMVIQEIGQQISDQQYIGIDLLDYMYYAMLDGYLLLYDAEMLQRAGRHLERVARSADEFRVYRFGDEDPPTSMSRRRRNVADMAFHMVHMLQDPDMLLMFMGDTTIPPSVQSDRPEGFVFTGDNLTQRDIQAAMDLALEQLRVPSRPRLQPAYMLSDSARLARRHRADRSQQEITHEVGNHAVAVWAMLASGESYQHPVLFKRINWVLSGDPPFTYDRGMRLQMLAHMPVQRWQPWVHRDRVMLDRGLAETGNWGYHTGMGEPAGWGDHANGQYGVLGLWGAQVAGATMNPEAWALIDRHWRATQQPTPGDEPAGWSLSMFNVELSDAERDRWRGMPAAERVTGPMTASGVVTLSLSERLLYGNPLAADREGRPSRELRKGLAWLDENFRIDDEHADDWYYYMWTIQRVGQITGRRQFNDVDWFRDVTAELLNRQQANGLWEDPGGRLGELMSTSFALLYLSSVNTPVAVAKLRFDGNWNNRPHDIWNFSDYASSWYEFTTGWQIVEAGSPLAHLIESPIIYLSSDDRFTFSDEEVQRLRDYIEAGGLLVVNQEPGGGAVFNSSLRALREKLTPGEEFRPLANDHPLFSINKHLTGRTSVQVIGNDIRPFILYFNRDIGEGLQNNDHQRSDSFALLSNTYLYTLGLNPRRPRLEQQYVHRQNDQPSRRLDAARIRHGGTYDPEPGALRQLQALLANDHDIDLQVQTLNPAELSDQRLAFLTTTDTIEMSDADVAALSQWVADGGTLWIDAAGGSNEAAQAVQTFTRQLAPEQMGTRLTTSDRIISGRDLPNGSNNRRVSYRQFVLLRAGNLTTPRLHTIRRGERPAVIVSTEDLTTGLAGLSHWGIYGYSVESARNLVINGVLDIMTE